MQLLKQNIELVNQNSKWVSIASTLQNQSSRITQIEQKIADYNKMKQDLTAVQNMVYDMNRHIRGVNTKMDNYDRSMQHYSSLCDDITSENTNRGEIISEKGNNKSAAKKVRGPFRETTK